MLDTEEGEEGEGANVQMSKCKGDYYYCRGGGILECLQASVQNVCPHVAAAAAALVLHEKTLPLIQS